MATIPHLLTYEEMLAMPRETEGKEEVVRGELRRMPPNDYPHAEVIQRLISRMVRQIDEKQIAILGSNFGLLISRDPVTCRIPELALYWRDKMTIRDKLYHSAPGLIVEVLSPSETKRRKQEKLEDYASIGVPEVWIVSPEAQSVEVRLLSSGVLSTSAILIAGDLRPSLFPGVSIPVRDLWPD
ncbi:MAG TPA: Uma2 family endonuclease [Bryobacteraceae bacterium]|nr:Uma2 family endonuclease [Bryobacteraceae bacterium]